MTNISSSLIQLELIFTRTLAVSPTLAIIGMTLKSEIVYWSAMVLKVNPRLVKLPDRFLQLSQLLLSQFLYHPGSQELSLFKTFGGI